MGASPLIRILFAVYALLIAYASLYPLAGWRDPGQSAFAFLAAGWPRHLLRFDILVNVLAYLPLGFLGVAVVNIQVPPVPAGTLVIHGELDTTIPLAAVLDWARPQGLEVAVVPGADHFFHRKLLELRDLVKASWQ